MPEDIPKTVAILIWLLTGTIIFGWLLMSYTVLSAFVFALLYFSIPVFIYKKLQKDPDQN